MSLCLSDHSECGCYNKYKLVLWGAFGPYFYCKNNKYGNDHEIFDSIEKAEEIGRQSKLPFEAVKIKGVA